MHDSIASRDTQDQLQKCFCSSRSPGWWAILGAGLSLVSQYPVAVAVAYLGGLQWQVAVNLAIGVAQFGEVVIHVALEVVAGHVCVLQGVRPPWRRGC